MPTLTKSEIKFNVDGVPHEFTVVHNLNLCGLSIESALDNWLARTKKFTSNNFCKYVMSKDVQIVCMSEGDFNRLNSN